MGEPKEGLFFWFGGILGSASRAEFPVSPSNHVGFTLWLLYSSTHHSSESVTKEWIIVNKITISLKLKKDEANVKKKKKRIGSFFNITGSDWFVRRPFLML